MLGFPCIFIHFQGAINHNFTTTFQQSFLELRRSFINQMNSLRLMLLEIPHDVALVNPLQISTNKVLIIYSASLIHERFIDCPQIISERILYFAKSFSELALQYGKLYQSYFDIDSSSMEHITALQFCCSTLASLIAHITDNPSEPVSPNLSSTLPLVAVCNGLLTKVLPVLSSVRFLHIPFCVSTQTKQAKTLHSKVVSLREAIKLIAQLPCNYPRYFFIGKSSTSVKLSISPTPKSQLESLQVPFNTSLVIRISGILSHSSGLVN